MIALHVVRFIATECERQQSGERSVWLMCVAWKAAEMHEGSIMDENLIKSLAGIIDVRNWKGYRTTPVTFRSGEVLKADHVDRQMGLFLGRFEGQPAGFLSMTPQEAYEWFERIHPFEDGNGRLGKIIFNLLNKTMDNPVFPFDPFKL